MRFLSCRDEGSILTDEQEPAEMRALLTVSGKSGSSEVISTSDQKPVKLRVFSLSELESATGGFVKANFLGKGSHGCLYKGTLKDGKIVAVKRQENLQDEAAFNNELEILSTLYSPRLVNLVGFSRGLGAQDKLLVVEFMANGTLQDVLHAGNITSSTAVGAIAAAEPLAWSLRVQIALQTAKALFALHSSSPPVIHRDVKSSSIFIDSKWNARLGDFGLALRGHSEDVGTEGGGGGEAAASPLGPAVGYRDPEDETPTSRISTKVDVFSFGILLLEILSGRNAIDVRFKPPSILDWALPLIKQGKTHAVYDRRLILLPQHSKALKLMAGIAARCVRRSSLRRPSMMYVVAALQEVSKKFPSAKWAGGIATVVKMTTSSCQTSHVLRDVRAGPELQCPRNAVSHSGRHLRVAVEKPVPLGKFTPPHGGRALEQPYCYSNEAMGKFVGQASSMDRMVGFPMREQGTRSAREFAFQGQDSSRYDEHKEEEEEVDGVNEDVANCKLPLATTEVFLGSRKMVYNQWRNPMFDVESRSPERALVIPVDICRPTTTSRPGNPFVIDIPTVRSFEDCRSQAASSRPTTPTGTTSRITAREGPTFLPPLPLSNKEVQRKRKELEKSESFRSKGLEPFGASLPRTDAVALLVPDEPELSYVGITVEFIYFSAKETQALTIDLSL